MKKIVLSLTMLLLTLVACSKNDSEVGNQVTDSPTETIGDKTPEVSTLDIANVYTNTATVTAKVIDKGSTSVTKRGVCISTTANPSIENGTVIIATISKTTGEFTTNLSNLDDGVTYYVRAFATNSIGTAYGAVLTFATLKIPDPIVYLDGTSFDNQTKFEEKWNMFYPWGTDHNGSARMFKENVNLKPNGVMEINSNWINWNWEGYSTAEPKLRITFHSGAVHLKQQIKVTAELPYWEISGDFQAPTVFGSWPAFWITGAWSWPPEVDILEFKGNATNWQNTVTPGHPGIRLFGQPIKLLLPIQTIPGTIIS
jgi:galactan endo-beta-1,3-galactanase